MPPLLERVTKLKSILKSKGVSTTGNKQVLVKRVLDLMQNEESEVERNDDKADTDMTIPEQNDTPQSNDTMNGDNEEEPVIEPMSDDTLANSSTDSTDTNQLKRKHEESSGTPAKKVKGQPMLRNPQMVLHEMNPDTTYVLVSESFQSNQSWFVMEVEFKGEKFQGSARSKKEAKQNAAAAALGSVVQFMYPDKVLPYVTKIDRSKLDFTSDSMEGIIMMPSYIRPTELNSKPPSDVDQCFVPSPMKSSKVDPNKHPVSLLSEMHPGLPFECVQLGPPVFTMQVVINGNAYQGYGKSKKNAKVGAAVRALRGEYNIVMATPDQEMVPSNNESEADIQISGNLPDLAHNLIHDKFDELTSHSPELVKHKVLAGIVMTKGGDTEGEVISLATGTKCIDGEHISNQGSVLFDCHAEIVSRRGLRRFLYQQLLALSQGGISVFERSDNGGYRLKEEVCFHLYINTAPCGDARIFSPHESSANSEDNHPNRRSRGLLRTKIENGEGTIPVDEGAHIQERGKGNVQQTWDAIIGGERLLTMSCSDKVAKWNVLGLQGSLLSLYIEPVYLSSIILGSLYHCKHLERAVFTRANEAVQSVQENSSLPPAFQIRRPLLAAVPNPQKRDTKKAPSFCLHWTCGETEAQVINTVSGRDVEKQSSNLCKSQMLQLFEEVTSSNVLVPRIDFEKTAGMTYAQLKNLATDYQNTKYLLMTGFHKAGCGSWVGKPSEVDDFSLQV